jgi:hypothetical protein
MQHNEQKLTESLGWLCKQKGFTELESKLRAFNPFRVLQVERYELRHTTTLAWLLDPRETHGMGNVFTKHFVKQIIELGESWAHEALTEIEAGNVEILRELKFANHGAVAPIIADNENAPIGDRLDILVEGKDWGIAVEAKIDSKEGENQLQRYDGWLHSMFDKKVIKLYLTVDEDPDNENWLNIQWGIQVKNALAGALHELGDSAIQQRVREFLADYHELVSGLSDRDNSHDESLTAQIRTFANQDNVASVLQPLQEAIGAKKIVRRWDDGGWPCVYWEHKFLLDLCLNYLRSRNASFTWETVRRMTAGHGGKWEFLTSNASKALTLEFVPNAWRNINNVTTAENDWNICYRAEFRNHFSDVEVKLHLRSGADHAAQVSILKAFLAVLPSDDCPADLRQEKKELDKLRRTACKFMDKINESIKVYSVKARWNRHMDGTLEFSAAEFQKLRKFKAVVEAHTKLLEGALNQYSSELRPAPQQVAMI